MRAINVLDSRLLGNDIEGRGKDIWGRGNDREEIRDCRGRFAPSQ